MSKISPFKLFFMMSVLAALLVVGACYSHPEDYRLHMGITGTWQGDRSGALLTIYQDGRMVLENVPGSDAPIKGQIERGFDQILLRYVTQRGMCGDSVGIYRFECDGKILTLDPLREDCAVRATQIDAVWRIKFRAPTTSVK